MIMLYSLISRHYNDSRFVKVHLGEIICSDPDVRSDPMTRNKWCEQYHIPKSSFARWKIAHVDETGIHGHSGRPALLDATAKIDIKAKVKTMQSSADGSKPEPPKRKAVEQLVREYATQTVLRTGKVLEPGEKVTVGKIGIREYRNELFKKRKAKDMSVARYKALHNAQHGFQSAVMFAIFLSHLDEAQKFNTDCTTVETVTGDNGDVRK
jgi:hypothetical protein